MAEKRAQRRLAAIMAADVVGYSRLMEQDETRTLATLKVRRNEVLVPTVAQHNGRVVKVMGDGVLVEFGSAVDAVQCAVELQKAFTEANQGVPEDQRIVLRIGINLGDVIVEGSDLYGDGVNVAARLEGLAEPGGIYVSGSVYEQVTGKLMLAFDDLSEHTLKNIMKPVRVYRAAKGGTDKGAVRPALALPDKPSIAVLPFTNMSGDAEHEYFADGIAEDIITGLSRLRWLFVIARNSSFAYKGRNVDARQVGRELGVRYILEGSVRTGGNRVRITGQLVDAETGNHLWAERYDRAPDDVFAIQDEITESVIGCIQPELYAAEYGRLKRKPPQNLDAWESFVRGMFLYSQHSDKGTREALDMLARAIELDHNYSQAHGLRAVCLAWRAYQGWEDRETAFAEVAEGANRAVACDPQEPWAYLAHGFVAMAKRRNTDAVDAFSRAIGASPNFAYAHGLLGCAHSAGGRPEQAIECIDRGVRLSPRDIFGDEYQLYYAFAHFQAGRYAEAASAALLGIQQRPDHPVLYIMAAASCGLGGETDKAKGLVTQLTGLVPNVSAADLEKNFFYCLQGDRSRLAMGLRAGGLLG
jgi:adenylate cyclase